MSNTSLKCHRKNYAVSFSSMYEFLRLTPVRFALLRFALFRFEPLRFVYCRFAPDKSHLIHFFVFFNFFKSEFLYANNSPDKKNNNKIKLRNIMSTDLFIFIKTAPFIQTIDGSTIFEESN